MVIAVLTVEYHLHGNDSLKGKRRVANSLKQKTAYEMVAGLVGSEMCIRDRVYLGQAEVREVFSVPKVGSIAGSHVVDGKLTRNASVRLLRDGVVVHNGKIASLRRFKDDVREVLKGYECGISLENFNDSKVGDVIESLFAAFSGLRSREGLFRMTPV